MKCLRQNASVSPGAGLRPARLQPPALCRAGGPELLEQGGSCISAPYQPQLKWRAVGSQ